MHVEFNERGLLRFDAGRSRSTLVGLSFFLGDMATR